jgi:hypothetical protein
VCELLISIAASSAMLAMTMVANAVGLTVGAPVPNRFLRPDAWTGVHTGGNFE